jgi:hypothetical protein
MRNLELWQTFSREEVHDIFSPDTAFTPQTGTWGLQGIVKVPERPGSFVFFVTFGTRQGDHAFDESITDDGVLTWQSQPKQRLLDATIQELIGHDDRIEAVYLFLRTQSPGAYTYCGVLGYLVHDEEREQPVRFQWQLLDWPAPAATIADMGLVLEPTTSAGTTTSSAMGTAAPVTSVPTFALDEVPLPSGTTLGATKTKTFKAVKMAVHPDQDARNKALGLAGEELVLEAERRRLKGAGRSDLAEKVTHVSVVEGDGAGYDIRSFDNGGDIRHLEVKTTRNGAMSGFFVSPNEIAFSNAHPNTFVLVRVFGYEAKTKSGSCYRSPGLLTESFSLTASEYRASPKS